jgi:hypothetical protein
MTVPTEASAEASTPDGVTAVLKPGALAPAALAPAASPAPRPSVSPARSSQTPYTFRISSRSG